MSENNNNNRQSTAEALLGELVAYCKSDSLSEGGLRERIERLRLSPIISDYNKFFFEACDNERINEGIIRYLLEYFPDGASAADNNEKTPLHYACNNKNVTLSIIQLLIHAAPESVRSVSDYGWMPLHYICRNENVDDMTATEIMRKLIEKCPESVRHATNSGDLPIHIASMSRSPDLCRVLIEAYPGSERRPSIHGMLPFHSACITNTVATVEYLYKVYPDAIHHTTVGGYPIHAAIIALQYREDPAAAVGIVRYLLECDPNVVIQKSRGRLTPLYWACRHEYNESNIEAALGVIKLIFDAHPGAIEYNETTSNIHRFHRQVQIFLRSQLVYSRQAKNRRLMTTPDENGQLPLHIALQSNVRLGSIKLLVKGSPPAVQSPNNSGALPLHVACQHHDSASVVQYLIGLDTTTLDVLDREGNTALHLACRSARYETISILLDKFDAVSVSKRNATKKLPIDLLFESNEVLDRESVEFTESIFRLLRAYPETVMNIDMNVKQLSTSKDCPSQNQNGKKRKFGYV